MNLDSFFHRVIQPSLYYCFEERGLLAPRWDTHSSHVLLLAIALHESGLKHRHQINGPALGWWQFEPSGGIKQILTTSAPARRALEDFGFNPHNFTEVCSAVEFNDTISTIFARLLLFSDPFPIPAAPAAQIADPHDPSPYAKGSFNYYNRTWQPGKPREEDFYKSLNRALLALPNASRAYMNGELVEEEA